MSAIPVETLRSLFIYDSETGVVSNRVQRATRARAGDEAGNKTPKGYRAVKVGGVSVLSHLVAWALYYGKFPDRSIDHINGVRDDNRITNLRLATHSENMQNCKTKKDNTSGFKGVHWGSANRKWIVRIQANGKRRHIGNFVDLNEAAQAYREAAKELHGVFANF